MSCKRYMSIMLICASSYTIAQPAKHTKNEVSDATQTALRQNPYAELPLGAIRANGWLKEMLIRQKNGMTGNLDQLYPSVMGQRNGWLGGDGDQWERGPYWIDGLLPLAYILNDQDLIAKTKPWVEWAIKSQQPDGYFGPAKDYTPEAGLQRDNSRDWWPKMVMLKVLKQYYSATADQRVLKLMTNYFKYQLKELPKNPLDHWSFWARYRGGDNLAVVYWLYNKTGDSFLLELADLLHKQTFDFTDAFLKGDMLTRFGSIHAVNLAQGMKEPLLYYQQHPENKYLDAMKKGLQDLDKYNGFANGMFGGDEALHGNNPTQGSELCTAVEMMFTLETALEITGDLNYADRLEKIAFNALPAQASEDYTGRQYFQQANQVMISRQMHNFDVNHHGTDLCYGLLSGYPCCTSNMHQGWPKFTQNLFYKAGDGVAALVYAPAEARLKVADGNEINIKEETNYPFEEGIRFTISFSKKLKTLKFPFHLRIPQWCKEAGIKVNDELIQSPKGNQIVQIDRSWKNGDVIELNLPMHLYRNSWYENSVSIERGPITYALKIGEEVKTVKNDKDPIDYGTQYDEVHPTTPWNYAIFDVAPDKLAAKFTITQSPMTTNYPWNAKNNPITIKTKARRIPAWKLYNEMAGPIPYSLTYQLETALETEEITLVPYGTTRLRISQFPIIR